ncbi:alpha/beta hydrolase [Ramlibacter sp.]|uniref:alpha/beta hydrolase n=1 Tax=Ramlibacter sp. TaxID=1917967 RepID=UPI002633DEC0|nr:alpha/beta hydrolase [Ramlibacter sp.]MDB5958437.1 alpha/beta hydrolase [Ramlibacter sp.]
MDGPGDAVVNPPAAARHPARFIERRWPWAFAAFLLVILLVLAAALAFGGPHTPPAMPSINDPFKGADLSHLPPRRTYTGEDGTPLAYRAYSPEGTAALGSVVLVHGSSASSESMHLLATAYAKAGYPVYSLDMRGHGASGSKGHIAYIGQLDDDLARFLASVRPPAPVTLVGFSAGAGFVLRVAGGARQEAIQSCVLLSPFLGQGAPNERPGNGGWVDVGIPRVVALSLLHMMHVEVFQELPVLRFALNEKARGLLTPEYSFALAANFRPPRDYAGTIRSVQRPCAVLGGSADEAFDTSKLEGVFRANGKDWPVTLVPGVNHIGLITQPRAVEAAVQAVQALRAGGG